MVGVSSDVVYTSTGCTLLDLSLGGGWAQGRVFNLVGDKSSGKTLLAIEAFANFRVAYPKGKVRYGEAEAAFDELYAQQLGFPSDVEKPKDRLTTVEEFHADLKDFMERCTKDKVPGMYILDSLDALSDAAEMDREIGEATFGVGKAKAMSEMFRKLVKPLEAAKVTLGIVSQVRDNIGVMFGEQHSRSGGKALDFYSSQICWLAFTGKIERTVRGQKRAVGVGLKTNIKKNKVGFPFRTCEANIIFGYGVDDEQSMIDWLTSIKAYSKEEAEAAKKELDRLKELGNRPGIRTMGVQLAQRTTLEWNMIEDALAPKTSKYGNDKPSTATMANSTSQKVIEEAAEKYQDGKNITTPVIPPRIPILPIRS